MSHAAQNVANEHRHDERIEPNLDPLEQSLLASLAALTAVPAPGTPLDPAVAAELFEAQVQSRVLDHTARQLRSEHGLGYYTIGSAGHESNAAVALALRPTDPALLHYRSGGFYLGRATQVPGVDPVDDVLRGMLARSTEPIAGGRHKVFGSAALSIIPQTSTIASHLPRAVGLALSLDWVRSWPELHGDTMQAHMPADAVVVCSFGDASFNHSTAQGAMNWALNLAHHGHHVPVLFVCEDNGLGISVPTPEGWVASSGFGRPWPLARSVDGTDPGAVVEATTELAQALREGSGPAFLRLRTVRYLGHAGTDVEAAYRPAAEIRSDQDRDPILATARHVVAAGLCTGAELGQWYLSERQRVLDRAFALTAEPELGSAAEIMEPLAPRSPAQVTATANQLAAQGQPTSIDASEPLTLALTINRALHNVLERDPMSLVFGEDVGRKGGVYGVTRGLQKGFGAHRVFDTILDEQSVLGLALGASVNGYLAIPEIQYLAYLHNAEDQLRGEAATLSFFSRAQYTNPMVVRVAGYAYQRGFGGHFHNDNGVAVLRDIPGIVVASPAHPADAAGMLMSCAAAARVDGTVSVFLEPIARYHTTDLHEGDDAWRAPFDAAPVPIGTARTHGVGTDGTILTWGNGLWLSLRAAHQLREQHGQDWRVVDLRWLAPLPVHDVLREASATGRALIVDETRHAGGAGEGVIAALVEGGFNGRIARVAAHDSFVPLGAAANLVLVDEAAIVHAAVSSPAWA